MRFQAQRLVQGVFRTDPHLETCFGNPVMSQYLLGDVSVSLQAFDLLLFLTPQICFKSLLVMAICQNCHLSIVALEYETRFGGRSDEGARKAFIN
jgi:hypothetical protein